MRRRDLLTTWAVSFAGVRFAHAQEKIEGDIVGRNKTYIALPDFRGKNAAPSLMDVFNATVWDDIDEAGILEMVSKSKYPLETPATISDVKLPEWVGAPVETDYLGFGNADESTARDLVVHAWYLNTKLADAKAGLVFPDKRYFGALTPEGARKVGHEYAADILKAMGVVSLAGSKIYFISNRTGNTEVWSMDYDGQNQQRMTDHKSHVLAPAVSPDGRLVAYTWMDPKISAWKINVIDTVTRKSKAFNGPTASMLGAPEFSPDGKSLWFSMPIDDYPQLVRSNVDGSGLRRISEVRAIEISPRINPKTGDDMLFISGRSKVAQLYRMKTDGTGAERITDGTGEAADPAWTQDGRRIVFAWTRGYVPGNYNLFTMNTIGAANLVQVTSQNGSNEDPSWAPDGVHLAYTHTDRGKDSQIWTMLANGRRAKRLTSAGDNLQPVWVAGSLE